MLLSYISAEKVKKFDDVADDVRHDLAEQNKSHILVKNRILVYKVP
jgi:hypothetical protein